MKQAAYIAMTVLFLLSANIIHAESDIDDIVGKHKEAEKKEKEKSLAQDQIESLIESRCREVLQITGSVVGELQDKGVVFESYAGRQITTVEHKLRVYMNYWPIVDSKFDDRIILLGNVENISALTVTLRSGHLMFKPKNGNGITIYCDDSSNLPASQRKPLTVLKFETNDPKTQSYKKIASELSIPRFDENAVKNKKEEIRNNVVKIIKASLFD
jgi:hypothetical protein